MNNTQPEANIPTIAIVGRPNVGKSSLFNAIIGHRLSIVHELSGVTRDRVIAPCSWRNRHFQLIDTGGLGMMNDESSTEDIWEERITEQSKTAIEEADVLIFVVNVQEGIVNLDEEVAARLRITGKPVLIAVNKADNPKLAVEADEMVEFGFGMPFPISCTHRIGIGALLDAAVELLPGTSFNQIEAPASEALRISIIGRPNVGKSSLVNALLGEERVMVSDIAGTTRDSIDVDFSIKYKGEDRPAVLVDTAGLRKKSKVRDAVELFSIIRAKKAIDYSDLVLFVVECDTDGVTAQDRRIASLIEESGKACIIVVNKIDNFKEERQSTLTKEIRYTLPGMSYSPLVFISAKERKNLGGLLDGIAQLMELMEVKVPTSVVNKVLIDAFEKASPPVIGNAPLKLYYASMISARPPKFLLFVNDPKYCAQNYLAYLKNSLRQAFDFTGFPIELELRARPKKVASFHSPERSMKGNKGHAKSRKYREPRSDNKKK